MTDLATLQSRIAARADQAKAQAAANRERHPAFTEFVDHVREVFGQGTKVRYVEWPDGSVQGKPFPGTAVTPVLPIPDPKARRTDPRTSKQAAKAATGLAADHHARILAALATPATCYQIGDRAGLDHVAVARRVSELRDAGHLRDSGRTAPGPSGRQCTVWERAA